MRTFRWHANSASEVLGKDRQSRSRAVETTTAFIEDLYLKRFDRERPERVLTDEQIAQEIERKEAERQRKAECRKAAADQEDDVLF